MGKKSVLNCISRILNMVLACASCSCSCNCTGSVCPLSCRKIVVPKSLVHCSSSCFVSRLRLRCVSLSFFTVSVLYCTLRYCSAYLNLVSTKVLYAISKVKSCRTSGTYSTSMGNVDFAMFSTTLTQLVDDLI